MTKFIFSGPPGFDKKEKHCDFPWHWYLSLYNNLNKEKQMTKYCIKLISEVYFEFDYEGALKNSCVPENYPEEIRALIMEEAKKLSDKNFYVGYCNERRGPVSWCNSSEESKEGKAGFVGAEVAPLNFTEEEMIGAGVGSPDFTDEELRSIKEETKGMSAEEGSAFLMNKYPDRFSTLKGFGLGTTSVLGDDINILESVITEREWKILQKVLLRKGFKEEELYSLRSEVMGKNMNDTLEFIKAKYPGRFGSEATARIIERELDPFAMTRKLEPEEEGELVGHLHHIQDKTIPEIIEYLKENNLPPFKKDPLLFSKWMASLKKYLKDDKESFNKPTETPVEKTGENNE